MRIFGSLLLLGAVVGCDQIGAARKQRELEESMKTASAEREAKVQLLVGKWHRHRPIDYQRRQFDMLEFILATNTEVHSSPDGSTRNFISDGFTSDMKGEFLSMLGGNLTSYFRVEGSTLQLNLVKPFEVRQRVDWEIQELNQTKLVVKDEKGQTQTFFRVDPKAHQERMKDIIGKKK